MTISISPKNTVILNLQTSSKSSEISNEITKKEANNSSLYERCQNIRMRMQNFFARFSSSQQAQQLQNVTYLSTYEGEKESKCSEENCNELLSDITSEEENNSPSLVNTYSLTFGTVELIQEIACGAFGNVYLGEYNNLSKTMSRQVAAKINLIQDSLKQSEKVLQSLEFEARLLHRLNLLDPNDSQHIVRYVDYSYIDINHVCLVLEHSDMNLKEFIQKNQPNGISLDRTAEIMRQIFQGLSFLHRQSPSVIHNDLKPANILVSLEPKASIRIADFGLACVGHQTNLQKNYICTRWYRSPEIVLGGSYGAPSDMWAAACIAFEIHTGSILFPAVDQTNLLGMQFGLLGSISEDFYKMIHPDCKVMLSRCPRFSESYELNPELIPQDGSISRWEFFNQQMEIQSQKHLAIDASDRVHTRENYILFRTMLFDAFKWFPARRSSSSRALNCGFIHSLKGKNSTVASVTQCTVTNAFS